MGILRPALESDPTSTAIMANTGPQVTSRILVPRSITSDARTAPAAAIGMPIHWTALGLSASSQYE